MNREVSRRSIDIVTGLMMGAGAVACVFFEVLSKLHTPSWDGTVSVSNWELLLFAALGAAPGWLLNGVLKRRLHPETHSEKATAQPRCKDCGAILARSGERCGDCGL